MRHTTHNHHPATTFTIWRHLLAAMLAVGLMLPACNDDFYTDIISPSGSADDTEAIRFSITTVEQADIIYDLARTRAAAPDSTFIRANTPQAFPFEGDAHGLQVHTMPLPLIEIHPGTASAPAPSALGPSTSGSSALSPSASGSSALSPSASGSSALSPSASGSRSCDNIATTETATEAATTRAPLSEIATNENFHDSLTIWGYISASTTAHSDATLFKKVNLKKVRGWRSSVHWPYDNESEDTQPGGSRAMRFYAISPAIDELELSGMNTPDYETAPKFDYHVVKEVDEHRDLLYGVSTNGGQTGSTVTTESAEIGINKGPIHGGNYTDNDWKEQRHLGQDDKLIDLKFEHILTAVRFAQGKIPTSVKITKISLQNIDSRGTFTGDATTAMGGSWSSQSVVQNYDIDVAWQPKEWDSDNYLKTEDGKKVANDTYAADPSVSPYIDGENVYIDRNQVMFLLPQELPATAKLQVELAEVYEEDVIEAGVTTHVKGETKVDALGKQMVHTIRAAISGTWAKGHTVTYKITIGELRGDYYLAATNPAVFSHNIAHSSDSQNGTFTVHSFRSFKDYSSSAEGTDVKSHEVKWVVSGLYHDIDATDEFTDAEYGNARLNLINELPGWNNASHSASTSYVRGINGNAPYTISFSINGQSASISGNHKSTLWQNTSNIGDNWDLSKMKVVTSGEGTTLQRNYRFDSSHTRTTANSYIINNYGTYHFPVVYGNAIEDNIQKDLSTQTTFFDSEGDPIRQAWIPDQLDSDINAEKKKEIVSSGPTLNDGVTTTVYDITKQEYVFDENSAKILWQDVNGLVDDDPRYNSGDRYISFGISRGPDSGFETSHIVPGNAVIALTGKKKTTKTATKTISSWTTITTGDNPDIASGPTTTTLGTVTTTTTVTIDSESNITTRTVVEEYGDPTSTTSDTEEILWAWHIWVTDEVYPNSTGGYSSKLVDVKNYGTDGTNGTTQKMMPVNLGWKPDVMDWVKYSPRQLYAKIQQVNESGQIVGNSTTVFIKQKANQPTITGTGPVFQWGRPAALPMVFKTGSNSPASNPIYDKDGNNFLLYRYGVDYDYEHITQWDKILRRFTKGTHSSFKNDYWWDYDSSMQSNYELWSTDSKTLYDPCPPGFQLPSSSVFTGFSKDGQSHTSNADCHNVLNGKAYQGEHLFIIPSITLDNSDGDYPDVIYMPASGYWSPERMDEYDNINAIVSTFDDKGRPVVWTGSRSDNQGVSVRISYSDTPGDRQIDFNFLRGYTRAMQIRPVGTGRYDR